VLDRRLAGRDYIAGDYSVADIAVWPWTSRFEWHRIDMDAYPNVKRWYLSIAARPAVEAGYHVPKKVSEVPRP
jgi:GST-like protein